MPTNLKPEMEAQIEALAERLALTDSNAHERVLKMALDDLDAKVPPLRLKMTPEEIAAEKAHWLEVGCQLRAKYPYNDDQPPSKVWQEELYDEQGLPK
jgi:hypothetical protein